MNKPARPSFATAAVAEITGQTPKPVNPDEALWPNAGTIRGALPIASENKDDNDKVWQDIKPEKITFSNKLEVTSSH